MYPVSIVLSLLSIVKATPPACVLACAAEVAGYGSICKNLADFSCILDTHATDMQSCLEKRCENYDNANSYVSVIATQRDIRYNPGEVTSTESSVDSTSTTPEAQSTEVSSAVITESSATPETEAAAASVAESSSIPVAAGAASEGSQAEAQTEASQAEVVSSEAAPTTTAAVGTAETSIEATPSSNASPEPSSSTHSSQDIPDNSSDIANQTTVAPVNEGNSQSAPLAALALAAAVAALI